MQLMKLILLAARGGESLTGGTKQTEVRWPFQRWVAMAVISILSRHNMGGPNIFTNDVWERTLTEVTQVVQIHLKTPAQVSFNVVMPPCLYV